MRYASCEKNWGANCGHTNGFFLLQKIRAQVMQIVSLLPSSTFCTQLLFTIKSRDPVLGTPQGLRVAVRIQRSCKSCLGRTCSFLAMKCVGYSAEKGTLMYISLWYEL